VLGEDLGRDFVELADQLEHRVAGHLLCIGCRLAIELKQRLQTRACLP
jgi:hypothetical protein